MQRREFLTLLGGAVVSPVAVVAQPANAPVVGFIAAGFPELSEIALTAFRAGLRETGFDEGRNVRIEYRWAHNDRARIPAWWRI
jgi:putative ABC transport system substrate-binding protein